MAKQFTFRFKDKAREALDLIKTFPGFELVENDAEALNTAVIRLANLGPDAISRKDITSVVAFFEESAGRMRSSYTPPKPTKEVKEAPEPKEPKVKSDRGPGRPSQTDLMKDKAEEGKRLCELLEGAVDGESCRYTKYELTAIGQKQAYSVAVPLALLSEETVAGQYFPSREEYENTP